jgi:hypothetical protein
MSALIFAGPSLRAVDRGAYPGLTFLPPARQGDLYAAACTRPVAIGLIDGYFDGVPAVLHKEILWALSQGIAVFGAASMGALRAAEMQGLGMVGVGRIFCDYRDGVLGDDDEVALLHGPAELDFPALSLPMVDLRATLARAVAQGVLDPAAADALAAAQKAVFYKRRNWPDLLAGLAPDRPELAAWLAQNRVDQKRADAQELLAAVAAHLDQPAAPAPAPRFRATAAWNAAPWRDTGHESDASGLQSAILDQLRLDPEAYRACRMQALLRHPAPGRGDALGDQAAILAELRGTHGLLRQADLIAWAKAQDLDAAGLQRLLTAEATIRDRARRLDARLGAAVLDRLRWDGRYPVLRAQALARLAAARDEPPRQTPPAPLLVDWFFRSRNLGIPADLSEFVAELGFSDLDRFLLLLAQAYALRDSRAP